MTSAQLQKIKEIFHGALHCEPDRVKGFLETACQGDEALRHEVQAVLTAHQQAGNFIEAPIGGLAARIIEKEPTRLRMEFADYELLEEIGRGGQGVVYRARQKSLNRPVALKVIGLGPWMTEAHLRRFRREAETAASLNHPCIVPIYEVGERDGACYFSMGLIEGGQLDAVLKREPMPIRCAVELMVRLARTVHYAHEHGILHRDIKPGNVLVDTKGEPHLTDFGLARLVETESTVTRTVEVLGTPSYMAPEQATANNTQLTMATDVYGLGAVLYQLLTGHPPFAGGTTYETIRLLLETEPRQPRQLNPRIDHDLSTICLKCLEKDPRRRYPSALELAEDLQHWLMHEPILARHTGIFARGKKWLRRNPTTALLAASLIALTATGGWIVWNSEFASGYVGITNGVAVLPFENLSGDPDNAYFANGIQEEILTRLASIANLRVISRTSTQRYQNKPTNLREIAKELGVVNIVEGSVQKAADQVRVNVQLVNAQTDSHLWADTYDRKLTDILGVESEIAKGIAESLEVRLTGREEQALAFKPTNNPEAYDVYLRGLAFQVSSDASTSPGSPSLVLKAAGFYERAVQLDPNFALAWARLSRADAYLYFDNTDTTAGARGDTAQRALENAQRLAPNSPQTLLALGYYQYWVLRDYGAAEITLERVSKMLPGSSDALHALGLVTRREGHWDQSIAYLEQALTMDPRNVESLMETAQTYAMLRRFPAALKLYDRALDITPNDPDVMGAQASVYQAQGNLQEAARFLTQITALTHNVETASIKFNQLRLQRNYPEALRFLQAQLPQVDFASQSDQASDQVRLALLQRLAGDRDGAKATAEAARNTLEQLYTEQSNNFTRAFCAAQLSQAYAAMGQKDLALQAAERAVMLRPRSKDSVAGPQYEENLALIQTIFGESSPAISTLTQLLRTPYKTWIYTLTPITSALLRLDPLWDPLRSDPRFQKLCEEKQP
jgi:serine/threonine protein kinase/Tfp pilus assembly protein PilF